jgi:hypothetical protein
VPDTTPIPANGEQTPEENWEQRYAGLQKVIAKRDGALADRQRALDALQAEHVAALLELADFRQKAVDASEDEAARQQYEQLRERFEPAPPTPLGANPPRDWTDHADRQRSPKPELAESTGYPT